MSVNTTQLDMLKTEKIRKVCRQLQLKSSGHCDDLKSVLIIYLNTDEGRQQAYEKLELSFLRRIFSDEDPIKTLVVNFKPEVLDSNILSIPSLADRMVNRKATIRCVCTSGAHPLITCSNCLTKQHWSCMGRNVTMKFYECIICQMESLDLSQPVVAPLVMPFLLPREDPKITNKRMSKKFSFDAETLCKIENSMGRMRVQIRCMKVDGEGFNNTWPTGGAIILNNVTIMEPHKLPERSDKPLDITNLLVGGENQISVLKYKDFQYYASGVFLIEVLDSYQLAQKIVSMITTIDERKGKAFVIDKFKKTEIGVDCIKVSLKCVLSMQVLNDPVRGTRCSHINCFGLSAFIDIQNQSNINK